MVNDVVPECVIAATFFESVTSSLAARELIPDTAPALKTTASTATVPLEEAIVKEVVPECVIDAAFSESVKSALISKEVTCVIAPELNRTASTTTHPFVLATVRSALPPIAPVCVIVCAAVSVNDTAPDAARVVTADTAPPLKRTASTTTQPLVLATVKSALPPIPPVCVIVCAAVSDSVIAPDASKVVTADTAPPLNRTASTKTQPFVLVSVKSALPPAAPV
mmetsp:Transcript_6523/g.11464  ORF Transcript_6523/g.11464 Transcript_6523/m.11464 type:complete len:223 (-) Transcript_6523:1584-2252(-)